MRILVVDDSVLSRTILKRVFAEIPGIEIVEASNGIEALEKHRSLKPEVIFMDITMPNLDGLGTLKIISLIDKKVKVIMVSSLGNHTYICDEALKFGAFSLLAKPLQRDAALHAFWSAQAQYRLGENQ